MPAPKGNKNAFKGDSAKKERFELRINAATKKKLEHLAKIKNIPMSEWVEDIILREYSENKSKK